MKEFFSGQRVTWQYTHHLNSRSTTEIVKSGTAIRVIRDRKTGSIIHPDYILVQFDGNKTLSKVKLSELDPEQI